MRSCGRHTHSGEARDRLWRGGSHSSISVNTHAPHPLSVHQFLRRRCAFPGLGKLGWPGFTSARRDPESLLHSRLPEQARQLLQLLLHPPVCRIRLFSYALRTGICPGRVSIYHGRICGSAGGASAGADSPVIGEWAHFCSRLLATNRADGRCREEHAASFGVHHAARGAVGKGEIHLREW